MPIASRWYVAVSMGETKNEEPTDLDDFGDVAERGDGLLPIQTAVPAAAGADSYLRQSMPIM
jgi:hypothetical protein